MVIQHNMVAQFANSHLKRETVKLGKTTRNLSSGYRINMAADDAAGLSISHKMRAQIRGLDRAKKNIMDGISYCEVADGALNEVNSIFNRMRELAVQSANDTNTNDDRRALNEEVVALKQEVTSIFRSTEFNGRKIWDLNSTDRTQIGTEKVTAVTSDRPYYSGTLTNTNKFAVPANGKYDLLATEEGITVSWTGYNGTAYTSSVIGWPDNLHNTHSFKLSDYVDKTMHPELQGIDFTYTYSVADYASLDDVIDSINGCTVSCYEYCSETAKPSFDTGIDNSDISFSTSFNYSALLASGKDFETYDTKFIEPSSISNLVNDPTSTTASSEQWIFKFDMQGVGGITAKSESAYYYSDWKDPDQKWWYTSSYGYDYAKSFYPEPNNGSISSVLDALNNSKGVNLVDDTQNGGYIVMNFALTPDSGEYYVGGSKYTSIGNLTMKIHVTETDTVDTVMKKLSSLDGLDIYAGNPSTSEASSSTYSSMGSIKKVEFDSPIFEATNRLQIQSGANSGQSIEVSYKAFDLFQLGIEEMKIDTQEDSQTAIQSIDEANKKVLSQRSTFGAFENRLEHAHAIASISSENTSTAESRIRDADMAREMVKYSTSSILIQATQAMLSQANKQENGIMQLLQ
ncbi:MAG: flagellin [bacterium]|nr:flagellin [bacterium]